MKKKILFLIPTLMHGGAEKVLINLANNLDQDKYEVSVQTLFDVGVHKNELNDNVKYIPGFKKYFRGNTFIVKLIPKKLLWNYFVKEHYDIVVSYLEGPTSRILSGCTDLNTKRVAWVHIELPTAKAASIGFRSPSEAKNAHESFDNIVAVSQNVKECFEKSLGLENKVQVLYNTNETENIKELSQIPIDNHEINSNEFNVCSVAKLVKTKGYDRLLNVHKKLIDEGLNHHIYLLGIGEEQSNLEKQMKALGIEDTVTLLGYKENPYQYVSKCDLYVCSSIREGFSTAVTEALIVGTPVVSTNCSGAYELLGEHNEYGIVTENSEDGIYEGMRKMLSNPELLAYYKQKAKERGNFFSRTKTVQAVEEMFDNL